MELSNSSIIYSLLLSIFLIFSIPKLVSPQLTSFTYKWCSDNVTYAPNSAYQSNLQTALNSLSTDTRTTNGFYNFTVGQTPDEVSSFALCRGDVPVNTCHNCIQTAVRLIVGNEGCPNQKQAFGYGGYCSIYFSNGTIYGKEQDNVSPWYVTDSNTISNAKGFNESLYSLMNSLQNQAASGNSSLKYAAGKGLFSGGQDLYGLVQCTPDLSKQKCVECIQGLISIFPDCCVKPKSKVSGVKIIEPSCYVLYNVDPFYGNVPNLRLSSPPPTLLSNQKPNISSTRTAAGGKSKEPRTIVAVFISVGMSGILVMTIVYSIVSRRRRLRSKSWMVKFSKDEIEALKTLQFSLRTVKNATQNFSDEHKLGEGGFGTVYKGVLSNGQEVAVKRCLRHSGQGDAEFKNEILILAKLRHINLVKLVGFCLHGKEMILIYEFVANRSLDYFVFGRLNYPPMMWETRYKIINGIVRGILYLHEESTLKIIHRDIKAGNVLLDSDFNPKIADFGMARLFSNIDQTKTMASRIAGTLGYISPEYAYQNQVSVKSDVYSFGVLVLEIVSGKPITSFSCDENPENLLTFAWRNWTEGTAWNLVDPTITENSSCTEILRCIHIGLLCVQDDPADRPTMSSVDLMLSSYSVTLQAPLQPAFFTDNSCPSNMLLHWTTTTTDDTTTYTTTSKLSRKPAEDSVNSISITELHPR